MSKEEKQILETLKDVLPKLNERERDNLLSFSKGMAFMKDKSQEEPRKEQ